MTTLRLSPYLLSDPPASSGRIFLARGFEHYCALHWGLIGPEIASAFDGSGDLRERGQILMAARLLGGILATGGVRASARPIGGGEPVGLRTGVWELDDFRLRFATSALSMSAPFDADAEPTHWIFVNLDDWNAVLEASVEPTARPKRYVTPRSTPASETIAPPEPDQSSCTLLSDAERLLRLPEVLRRTGLSRQTIYRRMGRGEFLKNESLGGNISVWRESEVAAWVASPR